MIVAIVQGSTLAPDAEVKRAMAAIQRQIDLHLQPAWGTRADLIFVANGTAPPSNAWAVRLLDQCDDDKLDGYHDFDEKPAGVVGVKTSTDDGVAWTATLSHEVLELIVDPWATICIEAAGTVVELEICDPVEGQPYQIDGVDVEDFVLPAYYRPDSAGPWNYNPAHPLPGPLTLNPGGYNSVSAVSEFKQNNGKRVRAAKLKASRVSRRGRRAARRR